MLNFDAFRKLCRKASIETNPAELNKIKETLQFMFRLEEIELYFVEKNPGLNPIKNVGVLTLRGVQRVKDSGAKPPEYAARRPYAAALHGGRYRTANPADDRGLQLPL